MYFVLRSDVALSKQFVFVRDVPVGLKTRAWKTGKPISPRPPTYTFVALRKTPSKLSDVLLMQFDLPIFSPKAIAVLDALGIESLQHFPVRIEFGKGRVESSYKIANVLSIIDCLDRKNAKIQTFPEDDDIMWLERYRLVEKKLGKKPPFVFRLGEFPSHLLAHESVKDAFERNGVTGASFVRTDKLT